MPLGTVEDASLVQPACVFDSCVCTLCVCVSPAAEAGGRFWEARDICPCRDMIHPHLGRSCWFLVGQVARGRQIAGQVAVLFSRGAHVVTQGDACGDPTATHWFYGLIAVFYQKQVLRR